MKTKVINYTSTDLILKEGTAGVYRTLVKTLNPNQGYSISVDTNSTYREYWCAVQDGDPDAVVLSSDDCQEFRTVAITLEDRKYRWKGISPRRGKKQPEAAQRPLPPAQCSSLSPQGSPIAAPAAKQLGLFATFKSFFIKGTK